MKNEIILYQSTELAEHIEVRVDEKAETIWLTQKQMAMLFDKDTDTIGLHLKNIFIEQELDENSTTEFFSVVQKEGNRNVKRSVKYYNLDAILSVGYRVNSKRGTQFRQWATQRLRDYLLKGYALNNRMNRIEDNIQSLSEKVNQQYGNFKLKKFNKSHDRFLIIDQKEIYHLGASLKDLGKKLFAFSLLDTSSVQDLLSRVKVLV